MGYFLGLAIGLTFGAIIALLWAETDIETEWKEPPYDWQQMDRDLWVIEPVLFTKQREEV